MSNDVGYIKTAQNYQLYLLPKECNWASNTIDLISEDTHGKHWASASARAFAMPFWIAATICQESVDICSELLHRITLKPPKYDLEKSFVILCKLAVAFFASIIADITTISLFHPEIYQRAKVIPPDPDKTPLDKLKEITKINRFNIDSLSEVLKGSNVDVSISCNQQKVYSPKDAEKSIDSYLWSPIKIEDEKDVDPLKPPCLSQTLEFDQPLIAKQHYDGLIYPEGTFIIRVHDSSCREVLPVLLEKVSEVDALIIESCSDLNYLLELDPTTHPVLKTVHTLSIRGEDALQADFIENVAKKLPSLKGLDLRDVQINGNLSENFLKKHVILSKGLENAQALLNEANETFKTAITTCVQRLGPWLAWEKSQKEVQVHKEIQALMYPEGTVNLSFDGVDCKDKLPPILDKKNGVNTLTLSNPVNLSFLTKYDPEKMTVLKEIRTLGIQGRPSINSEVINKLLKAFPNLKYLDIREATINTSKEKLSQEFKENVKVYAQNFNNCNFDREKVEAEPANPFIPIIEIFGKYQPLPNKNFTPLDSYNPIYAYISNLSALRGIPIGAEELQLVLGAIRGLFLNLSHFDLSKNSRADLENLGKIAQFPRLRTLKIRDCNEITKVYGIVSPNTFSSLLMMMYRKNLVELDIQQIEEKEVSYQLDRLQVDIEESAKERGLPLSLYYSEYQRGDGWKIKKGTVNP